MPVGHKAGRLVAVIVTYNRLDQLKITLQQVLAAGPADLAAVLVVDNASTDDTESWLAQQADPRLSVLRCATNGGGAGGFEAGMRHAVAEFNPDWLVVMDDDARPYAGCLARFQSGDRSCAEAWAAAVYHPDGRICDMNRPSINPFWHRAVLRKTLLGGGRDGFHLGAPDYASPEARDVDGASFVGLFVSRAAIERVGYPDGRLFLYGDDVLYTLGLRAAGGRIRFDPELRFEHDFTTMTDTDRRFRPLWKTYYHYRNLLMVYRMAAGGWFWLALPGAGLKWLFKLRYHSGERARYTALVLRALRDGVLRRTDVSHVQVVDWATKKD